MNRKYSQAIINRKSNGFIPVIPDIKCRSPKEGDLLRGRNPVEIALMLEDYGAPALSVVTERDYFCGSIDLMQKISSLVKIPVLRKDFINSTEEIKISKESGADAVLLISSMLTQSELKKLYEYAVEIELEPLVETHTAAEMEFAAQITAQLVGINNRDILQLEKDEGDVSLTRSLASHKPDNSVLISESSISSAAEVESVVLAGADAVLIGTAIWQAENLLNFYHDLSTVKHRIVRHDK
jgi:indole-3-glycerol phosphate synthase